jgi:hypothetical protein
MITYGCGKRRLVLAILATFLGRPAFGAEYQSQLTEIANRLASVSTHTTPIPQSSPSPAPAPAVTGTTIQAPAATQEPPFVPALEVPDAVYIRLGNEMLAALADSIPALTPADALKGAMQDVQTTSSSSGTMVNVHFSGIYYNGQVSRVTMEAIGEDRLNVVVALRNVNLVFSNTYLSGSGFSASCGPIRIVLGHREDLPLAFQLRPVIENGKIRFKLLATQFRLDPNNWTVGSPAWVNISGGLLTGLFVSEGQISQGLRDGIYRDSSRIEREVAGTVPRMLSRLEDRFSLEPTEQIVAGLWPLPVYKPALRSWPSYVATDDKGITVGLGVSVAAFDPRTAPAQPKRVELSRKEGMRTITTEKFQFGVAPELMEPLSSQVVSDDAARAQVPDMPMQKLQPLADVAALGEIVPDLKQRGDKEVRAEMRLMSPLQLHRGGESAADSIAFELPKVRCAIDVHPEPTSTAWMPYLEIDFSIRHAAKPSVRSPTPSARVLSLSWLGDAIIDVQTRFAPNYTPSDSKIDTNRIHQVLADSWQEWTSTGALAQASLEDLDLGFAKLRADSVGWSGDYLGTTFGAAGFVIKNLTGQPMEYEVKGPYSAWGGPYKLEAGEQHSFPIAYPMTCRFGADREKRTYTLPPGVRFEFQNDANGVPDLFTSRESDAVGLTSLSRD